MKQETKDELRKGWCIKFLSSENRRWDLFPVDKLVEIVDIVSLTELKYVRVKIKEKLAEKIGTTPEELDKFFADYTGDILEYLPGSNDYIDSKIEKAVNSYYDRIKDYISPIETWDREED